MVRSLNFTLALALAAALLTMLALGPGAARSEAAQCKGSDRAASRMSNKRAAKATLCALNKERSSRGLRSLHMDRRQVEAAGKHNRLMVRKSCFSHLCPGEKDLVGRIAAAGYLPCTCTWLVGENLAWGAGSTSSPRKIVAAWMNSPPHRVNVLNPKFDEVGIAVDRGSPAGGSDDAATYTANFGFKG